MTTECVWKCRECVFICGKRTLIAGVLNVTPDSFSDGGRYGDPARAVERAIEMETEGADIIDIGGESSRPGAAGVSAEDEIRRVVPVIKALRPRLRAAISIDTAKAKVAREALTAGADIINDIAALGDPDMARAAAESGAGVILMHMRGDPRTMQNNPHYKDVVAEVGDFLGGRARRAIEAGIRADRIAIDPGIGFGKTLDHNLALITAGWRFRSLGYPVMVGASRKSFIGRLQETISPADRLEGSLAAAVAAVLYGADIVRVHDIRATRRAVAVAAALRRSADRRQDAAPVPAGRPDDRGASSR